MRLIDADALLLDIRRKAQDGFPANRNLTLFAESCVAHAPTVDTLPVLQGRWRKLGVDEYVCTNCWRHSDWHTAWCPHCGAKMELE